MLLDTNVLIEIFDRRSEEGTKAAVTDLTLDSVLIIMEDRGKDASELAKFISSIATYRGLRLYWLSLVDRLQTTGT